MYIFYLWELVSRTLPWTAVLLLSSKRSVSPWTQGERCCHSCYPCLMAHVHGGWQGNAWDSWTLVMGIDWFTGKGCDLRKAVIRRLVLGEGILVLPSSDGQWASPFTPFAVPLQCCCVNPFPIQRCLGHLKDDTENSTFGLGSWDSFCICCNWFNQLIQALGTNTDLSSLLSKEFW